MSITKEEVADAVREWLAVANDPERIAELVAMESQSAGFGYRTSAWRDIATMGGATYAVVMAQFWKQVVYFRTELNEFHASVAGDVGLAWFVYTEEFQEKGRPPERAMGRGSIALSKGPNGWQVLLFHRDVQPFDPDGRYPRSLTTIQPAE